MAASAEQYQRRESSDEAKETLQKSTESSSNLEGLRSEIGRIAETSFGEGAISRGTYQGYVELATGREKMPITADGIKGMMKFAQEHDKRALRLREHLEKAEKDGVALEGYADFIMAQVVTPNEMNLERDFPRIEKLILDKIKKRREQSAQYDEAADHPLVQEGRLKINDGKSLTIPKRSDYLKMKDDERDAFVERFTEALKEAEEHLNGQYETGLKDRMEAGVLGRHSYMEFMEDFMKQDTAGKVYYASELDAQMEPYESLWEQIHSTLEEEEVNHMVTLRDDPRCGYSELLHAFGDVIGGRLDERCKSSLEEFRAQGIVGAADIRAIMSKVSAHGPKEKYAFLERLHDQAGGELEGHRLLWEKIAELPEKKRTVLNAERDTLTFSALQARYQGMVGEGGSEEDAEGEAILMKMSSSSTIRDGVKSLDEELGNDMVKYLRFTKYISRIVGGQTKDYKFSDSLRERREANMQAKKDENEAEEANDKRQDAADMREKMLRIRMKHQPNVVPANDNGSDIDEDEVVDELEDRGADVLTEKGFTEVEQWEGDETARSVFFEMDTGKAVDLFLERANRRAYQQAEQGGEDDVHIASSTGEDGSVELNLDEKRGLVEYLKHRQKRFEEERFEEKRKAA